MYIPARNASRLVDAAFAERAIPRGLTYLPSLIPAPAGSDYNEVYTHPRDYPVGYERAIADRFHFSDNIEAISLVLTSAITWKLYLQ